MEESHVSENVEETKIKVGDTLPQDDVVQQNDACATQIPENCAYAPEVAKLSEGENPPKKRKTRRGKSKRRYPYVKNKNSRKSNKLIKPEAPHNSNQFLLEDHGLIEELDEKLRATPSTLRTRDSSFSVDTDGEFYSSPDDEEQFLIQDFYDQYESLHAERLQAMSKSELIQEYLVLESKLDQMSKRLLQKQEDNDSEDSRADIRKELERLNMENERLKRENELLRSKTRSSGSEDSETDSSSSCSTSSCSTSSCSSRSRSPIISVNYDKSNGQHPSPSVETLETVVPV